jgi:O-antigen/teichoic acid export membrane protein
VGLTVVAEPLVRVLLGEKWLEAIPIISILAISAAFVAASGNNGIALLALGYAKLLTVQSFMRLLVLVVSSAVLAPAHGILGVAIAELCGAVVVLLASYPVVFRYLNISVMDYWASIWRPLIATAGMAVVVEAAEKMLGTSHDIASALIRLSVGVGVGIATYVVLIVSLWWLCGRPNGAETIVLHKVSGVLRAIRCASPH